MEPERGVEIQHQGPDLGAQEVVRATRAHGGQLVQALRTDEVEHGGAVVEMADLAFGAADAGADLGHQPGRRGAPLGRLAAAPRPAPPNRGLPRVCSSSQAMALLMIRSVVS